MTSAAVNELAELAELAEEWALTLTAVSDQTKIVYARSVNQFLAYLTKHHPRLSDGAALTRKHVDGWMGELARQGRSEGTRRVRLIAVRLFLGYLVAEPDIALGANPAAAVALPTPKDKIVPVVRDEDLAALLGVCERGTSFADRRDAAILRVLIDTGCRRSELVGIDVTDLDLRAQDIALRQTKGRNERVVPIGTKTSLALRRYLRARAKRAGSGTPPLFLSIRPTVTGGWRLSGGGVAEMITRRCEQAGVPPIHPHQFRHTWAHDHLAHGANEGDVERLAGWRSPMMVRRYVRSAAHERARDAARRLARGDRV
jgi:integrase